MEQNSRNSKRIAKNTAFLFIRQLILLFISLYTSRVVLDKLGVEDFGVYNVVGGFVGIFGFLKTSFSSVTQRFLNIELGKDDLWQANCVFNQHLILYAITVVVVFILFETVGLEFVKEKLVIPTDRLDTAIIVYHFSVITICINILGIVYNSAIIAHEDMKVFSYIGIAEGVFKLGIAFMIAVTDIDRLLMYGLLMMLVQVLVQLFNFVYCRRYIESKLRWVWNRKDIRQTSRFIGWDFVNNIVFIFKDQFVTILLNMFFGPVVNAARAVTAQINMAVSSFTLSFMISVKPQLVKSYSSGNHPYMKKLYFKSSKYALYLMWTFCLPLILCINTVLSLWLKEVPEHTCAFVVWNLLEGLCAVLLTPNSTTTMATGRLRRYVLTCGIVNLMVFPSCYVMFYLGYDPVWAYTISFILRFIEVVCAVHITNRYIHFGLANYLRQVVLPFSMVCSVSFIFSYFCHEAFGIGFLSLVLTTVVSIVSIAVAIWLFGSTKGEKGYFLSYVKNRISKYI